MMSGIKRNRVLILVYGGVVQTVYADEPSTEIILVDEDNGDELNDVKDIPSHLVF